MEHDQIHVSQEEAEAAEAGAYEPAPLQPKVAAAGVAGFVTTILVFVAAQLGLEIPGEVAAALTGLLAFAAGYLKA